MVSRRFLATALTLLLAGILVPARVATVGVVLQAKAARIGGTEVSPGATVFDGDLIETGDQGALQLRAGKVQLGLSPDSAITLNQSEPGLNTTLERGTVSFSMDTASAFELRAHDVRIRPKSAALIVGQATLEQCDVLVTSQRGALEVTAGKETKIVEEGKSYRVVFDRSCGSDRRKAPPFPASSNFVPVAIGTVAAITIIAIREALESPDRP